MINDYDHGYDYYDFYKWYRYKQIIIILHYIKVRNKPQNDLIKKG